MKTKFLLSAGLLFSAMSYGQTVLGTGAGTNGGVNGENVHIGKNAGSGDIGSQNTIVGSLAGTTTTTNNNTFLGFKAGQYSNQNNSFPANYQTNNIFIGYNSGVNANGISNSFLGSGAGYNSTGSYNTFIGTSGQFNTGNYNVFMGYLAGNNAIGNHNVCIGPNAGGGDENTHLGSKNVLLGYRAGISETGSNKLYISNFQNSTLVYGEFMTLASAANEPVQYPAGPGILKFNAQKVGIGYEQDYGFGFGSFPTMTGITNAGIYRLFVKGGILAEEVRVRAQNWPDYVFTKDYKLMSLKDTEKYIADNGHLPNMPSAAEVEAYGVEMSNTVKLQQEKIEELTLHLIEQDKQIELLKAQNKEIETLKAQMQQLLKKQ